MEEEKEKSNYDDNFKPIDDQDDIK